MRNEEWTSWGASFDAEWRDEVDPPGTDKRCREDFDDVVADLKDMARGVVECTLEPLRSLARSASEAAAFEHRHWRRARRRWARSSRW
jgi:hypothetical protein